MLASKVQFLLTKTDYVSIKISPSPFKAFLFSPRVSLTGNLFINISLFCYVLYVHMGRWTLNMKLQTDKEAVLNDIASLSDEARSLRTNTTPHNYCCGMYFSASS
jgi:surface polysaccharide O-acyltransferase-like enzyme